MEDPPVPAGRLPEGFAFAAMFAAVLGSLVAAPVSGIVLVALTTQIEVLQLAPVAIAPWAQRRGRADRGGRTSNC